MIELPVVGELLECKGCGRKILVERGLIGSDHTVSIFVTCWHCLNWKNKENARRKYRITEK